MKYLKDFKLFESYLDVVERWDSLDYEAKVGKLLYLYSPIPISRDESSVVIPLVLKKYGKKYDILNDKDLLIDFNNDKEWDLYNSLRFSTYFYSLIKNKSTLGFNFEGTVAGFFGGKIPDKDYRHDVVIDDKCFSVKTSVVESGDSIVIGSFKNVILNNSEIFEKKYNIDIIEEIKNFNGIGYFFSDFYKDDLTQDDIKNIKHDLLDIMFSIKSKYIVPNKVDYIVISFFDINKPKHIEPSFVDTYIIDINDFIKYLIMKGGISPKSKDNIFQLRVSKDIIHENRNKITFKFKKLYESELDDLRKIDSLKWASKIFKGHILSRMRPDVIDDLYKDRHNLTKKLKGS